MTPGVLESSADLYARSGDTCLVQEQYEQAIEAYGEALKLDKNQLRSHLGLGRVFLKLNDLASAEKQFHRVLLLKKDNLEAFEGKIIAILKQADYPRVVEIADSALKLVKNKKKILFLKGKALLYQGNFLEANEIFAQFEHSVRCICYRGFAFFFQRDMKNAAKYFAKVLSVSKQHEDIHSLATIGLALLQEYQDNESEAEKLFSNAIPKVLLKNNVRLSFSQQEIYLFQGMGYQFLGNHEAALRCFNIINNSVRGLVQKGLLLFAQKKYHEARPIFTDILCLAPNNRYLRVYLDYIESFEQSQTPPSLKIFLALGNQVQTLVDAKETYASFRPLFWSRESKLSETRGKSKNPDKLQFDRHSSFLKSQEPTNISRDGKNDNATITESPGSRSAPSSIPSYSPVLPLEVAKPANSLGAGAPKTTVCTLL